MQKFDSAGRFLLAFGSAGTGPGQFSAGQGLALGPAGKLYAGDNERIERFNLEGEYQASLPLPGETVQTLAVDPVSGDLYASSGKEKLFRLNSTTGAEIGQLEGEGALATNAAGDLFAVRPSATEQLVLEYDSSGKPLSPASCCESPEEVPGVEGTDFLIAGLATNTADDLYVAYFFNGSGSFIRSFGPGPVGFELQPPVPPQITAQFATSVQKDGATVAAEINPHFWPDTRYYVQYGTGKCSEGGCVHEAPLPPGTLLTSKQVGLPQRATVPLESLNPGTVYHYRFVAKSSGGGPVFGVGGGTPEGSGFKEVGEESSFTTFEPLSSPPCSNDGFRTGAGAHLPDCRAYEMVSPVDKNNGDVEALIDPTGYSTALDQSSAAGEKLTYSSYRSFGVPKGAPYTNQYIASRDSGSGWSSEAIDVGQSSLGSVAANLENPYKAFSEDLCQSWLVVSAEPLLAPGATDGYHDLYRRDGCGGEAGYEALIGVPPSVEPEHFNPELQGTSADGKQAILRVEDKLTPEATSGIFQTYYASEGGLHLVCILPNGLPSGGNCSGGTGGKNANFNSLYHLASVSHAISNDGSKVYWTDSGPTAQTGNSGPGRIFLRENPGQPESAGKDGKGNCVPEAERACTLPVSETKTKLRSYFLGASADGSKALFRVTEGGVLEGNLYEFTVGSPTVKIAGETLGVAAASEDLSHLYFVSKEVLAGTTGATEGKPNLYLDQNGSETFVATLSRADVVANGPSDTAAEPVYHAARATADGSVLVFISTEPLGGYDNADVTREGEADSEVYRYEAGASAPACISCNPGGARPQGRVVRGAGNSTALQATAAAIPLATADLYAPRALSANGKRLFFDSFDALLPRDTNGKEDVYEWEAAGSREECEEKGAEAYVESAGGCLSLISSGESPQDSEFVDAGFDGRDAFFATSASLLPQDPGLVDIYDARVEGGFPQPTAVAACEGEACQSPPEAPRDPTPASASFQGSGNVVEEAPTGRARCAKGKVRRKGRCTSKPRKKSGVRAKHKRRAGR